MQKENRKRRHSQEFEIIAPKNKFRVYNEYTSAEEAQLSEVLFGGTSSFLRSLEEAEQETQPLSQNIDSGIGETDSDDGDSRDRTPAWVDEEDDGMDVGVALNSQGRRLPSGGINSRSNKYTSLLKHKFKTIVGNPKWASLDNKNNQDDYDSDSEILQTCGFIKNKAKSQLPESTLEYKKLKDLNSDMYIEKSPINVLEFHPTSSVSLVAGNSGVAVLFAVDGKQNNKIHSVAFQKYPIYCARFINSGNDVVLGSRYNYIYNYDLMSASANKISLPQDVTHCKYFDVSPDGKYLAIIGKYGEIHILSSTTKERVMFLKQHSTATSICFNPQGNLLYGHSETGEVTIWDINMRRVKHKWIDDGCIRGSNITVSSSNQFVATGSAEGVVNVYDTTDTMVNKAPKPKKTLYNLTTGINDLKFNSTSEMLAFSSTDIESSVRLLHLGSLNVFNNFPSFGTKLGHITIVNFSPGSGYLAIANKKSTVALYRLKHYNNY